jgi:membrane protease YdiL (CAAX protease family)
MMQARTRRYAWLFGALAWVLYILYRTQVQQWWPVRQWQPVMDWASFVQQDLWISGGRLLVLAVCGTLAWRAFGGEALGLKPLLLKPSRGAVVAGLLVFAGDAVYWMLYLRKPSPGWVTVVEVAVAALVACNEELAFRGLFLESAKRAWGPAAAAWVSTVAFMAMHCGYVPWSAFPQIFLVGITFSRLRLAGAPMLWLILVHAAVDGFYAVWQPAVWSSNLVPVVLRHGLLILAWVAAEREYRRSAGASPQAPGGDPA